MINSLDKYIEDLKSKINDTVFTSQFTRLANLYYLNGQYEECADICKIGLEIYPDYLTAKLILLKALIKLEYIGDAEILLNELDLKIGNFEIAKNYRDNIEELKKLSRQEKICYPTKNITITDYEEPLKDKYNFDKSSYIEFEELLELWSEKDTKMPDKIDFKKFEDAFMKYKIKQPHIKKNDIPNKQPKTNGNQETETLHFLKIKMITETFADLLANQGYYKEAFNIYNSLLNNEDSNKKRLLDKLTELERNFI